MVYLYVKEKNGLNYPSLKGKRKLLKGKKVIRGTIHLIVPKKSPYRLNYGDSIKYHDYPFIIIISALISM